MKVEMKTWAGLGLATALSGVGLTSCAENTSTADEEAALSSQTGERGEGGENGEGGESGEGGVTIAEAGSDPVIYGSALAIAEAHAIAAHDAFKAGKTDPAAEMFGHPVSEVLADLDAVFAQQGVDDLKPLFNQASAAVLDGENAEQIEARYEAIIAALRGAADKAPDNGMSESSIAAGVTADMIERATAMYREASGTDRYEPYLDGYGFYRAGQTTFDGSKEAIKAENPDLHDKISEALSLLKAAYPSAERPETLNADQSALTAAGSKVLLAL